MEMRVNFFVPGLPAPAGSKKAFAHASTGKIVVTDTSGKRGRDWRASVADHAVVAMQGRGLMLGPVRLLVVFGMPRPKGHYGTGRNASRLKAGAPKHHTTKPDATKLLRAVEDAMTGIVWRDDAQVVEQEVRKIYDRVGVHVLATEMEG